jgi:molybdopterin synthase catalytic subunit
MSQNFVKIQTEDFNLDTAISWLQDNEDSYGALVTFTGVVREAYEGNLTALFLEHYPGMTEKTLDKIIEQARERWSLGRVMIIHRVGELYKNDNIVFIGVISAHRVNAFNASQFIMDYLKKEAPFWKKEKMVGSESWVAQKKSDLKAADNWIK